MRAIVSYDVTDDRVRARVVKRLKRCAHRLQYSVFEGDLPMARWDELWRDLTALVDEQTDSLMLLPLCATCARGRRFSGRGRAPAVPHVEVL